MSGGDTWLRWARDHPGGVDVATAALFVVSAVAALWASKNVLMSGSGYLLVGVPFGWRMFGSALSPTLPLVFRRRFPVAGAIAAQVGYFAAQPVFGMQSPIVSAVAVALAFYGATAHGDRRWRVCAVLALFLLDVASTVLGVKEYLQLPNATVEFAGLLVVLALAVFVFSVVLGAAVSTSRRQRRELADQAEQLRVERAENARRAVAEERLRISRELHDVVAHHVSLMGVQAGAARRVMHREPQRAQEALTVIETSSRQAIAELQHLLGFLRNTTDEGNDSDAPGAAEGQFPQPGVAQLADLVARTERSTLEIHGPARELPRSVEVSIYRVVQEALTNTMKHCRGAAVSVALSYQPSVVEVTVRDDGRGIGAATEKWASGHGLIGMRERVALHQGELRAGPQPQGGFGVHARFPVGSAQS